MTTEKHERAEIGRRIKRLRQTKELTAAQLAKRSGVSAGYLSEVERGIPAVSIDKLRQIADGLETTLEELLGDPPTAPEGEGVVQIPTALSDAADRLNLSHRATLNLLQGQRSLVARRSQSAAEDWSVEDWIRFHEQVKDYLPGG